MVTLELNASIENSNDALDIIENLDNDLDNVVDRLERLKQQGIVVQLQVNESAVGTDGDGAALVAKLQDA